jgi:hypothetical protein
MKTICERSTNENFFVGVIGTQNWFEEVKIPFPFTKSDYVVGTWFDFSDGVNHHIEGKTTIAMCKALDEAEVLYKYRLEKMIGI